METVRVICHSPSMRYTPSGRNLCAPIPTSARLSAESLRRATMSSEEPKLPSDFVVTDRRGAASGGDRDRRNRNERRQRQIPVAVERRAGGERRQLGERRRQVDPTTCEK